MPRLAIAALTLALMAIPAVASTALAAPTCGGLQATIVGDGASQIIVGTRRSDVIMAGGGNDLVLGLGGDDVVCGEAGRDLIFGGRGADRIFGDDGNDRLRGGVGFDELDGGAGNDRCFVGPDGGTETSCGGAAVADLAVEVSAENADEGESFQVTVVVRNLSGAPSGAFSLVLSDERHNVTCESNPSGTVSEPSLGAGQSREHVLQYSGGCDVTGDNPELDVTATIQQPGSDDNASNDTDTFTVEIVEGSQG